MDLFKLLLAVVLLIPVSIFGQSYTSYFTGNLSDTLVDPAGGICLMGGGLENDEAMKWFLNRSGGGDVLVIRTSGADGYNNYLFNELGVPIHSVETILFHHPSASKEAYIHQKINQAEAIWIAGGDQKDYVTFWRNTAIDSLINLAIINRHAVIGGISAGMAIMGQFYFSAYHGTVSSEEALSNPYSSKMTIDSACFLKNTILQHVITDTHYNDPVRKGRHVAFLARILTDWGIEAKGIACDENAAVCIDTTGLAHCYGDGPVKKDYVYFLQTNCELAVPQPEICVSGRPLEWNRENQALKVYKINGTSSGENTFSLIDWRTGTGGTWENWYVHQGNLVELSGTPVNCPSLSIGKPDLNKVRIYPNPVSGGYMHIDSRETEITHISIMNIYGQIVREISGKVNFHEIIDVSELSLGIYLVQVDTITDNLNFKVIVQ